MADSPDSGDTPGKLNQLVSALNQMRDTLVQVSLLLRDFQFETDEAGRREVADAVNKLLNDAKNMTRKS